MRSEENYREVMENINDAVFSADGQEIVTYMSPVARLFGGYDPAEMMGRSFSHLSIPRTFGISWRASRGPLRVISSRGSSGSRPTPGGDLGM